MPSRRIAVIINYVGHQRDKYDVKTSACRYPTLSDYRVLVKISGFGLPATGQSNVLHLCEKIFAKDLTWAF
jgi:hypothetical protein